MDNIALVSPNTFNFEIRNKFGIKSLKYHVVAGKPFLLPREVAEKFLLSDSGNFQLYSGSEKPETIVFAPTQAYAPPPTFNAEGELEEEKPVIPKIPDNAIPVEVEIFLEDLLADEPKVHLDMILPGEDRASILTDNNITFDQIKLVADKLEVPYDDKLTRDKLNKRIIEVATARLNNS